MDVAGTFLAPLQVLYVTQVVQANSSLSRFPSLPVSFNYPIAYLSIITSLLRLITVASFITECHRVWYSSYKKPVQDFHKLTTHDMANGYIDPRSIDRFSSKIM
jgi:hypothetical protein